jgi:hypothetical protein
MTGLFATDAELVREVLRLPAKIGRRVLAGLDAGRPRAGFPKRDPLFGNRRFVPAVVQWFHDYYGVRASAGEPAPTIQPMWQERFDELETGQRRRERGSERITNPQRN